MPAPLITQLGTFTGAGSGTPRVGQVGDHTFTATLAGSGSVSATVLIEVSNDNTGWTTLATLALSGTASAAAQTAQTSSYAFWRATVSAMTGTSLSVSAATEQVTDASQLTSAQKAKVLALVSGAVDWRATLRAALASRPIVPYQLREPLLALPVLPLNGTAYAGDLYTDGGYVWYCPTGGTTGAAGPAVGANLADPVAAASGTARFVRMDAVLTPLSSDLDTPSSVTEVTVASLSGMRFISPFTAAQQDNYTYTCAPRKVVRGSSTLSLALPSIWTNGSSWYGDSGNAALIGYAASNSRRVGFVTHSKRVLIRAIGQSTPLQYFFEVNGKPLYQYGCRNSTGGTTNPGGTLLTFPDRRRREIWIGTGSNDFYGVYVETAESIAPAGAGPIRMTFEGDSLTAGGNNTPYYWRGDWPSQLADSLAIRDACNLAVGGTGFVSGGANSNPLTSANRVAAVLATNPDILVVGGGHNDAGNDGTFNTATRTAAYNAWYASIRAARPILPIVIFGSTLLRGETNASITGTADVDLAAAIAAWQAAGDTNVWWIPSTTGTERWSIDGTVSPYFYTSGDGHPIQAGMDYNASRYINAFFGWIESL